jgi:polyisoprenoid-binding protein YceI
VGGPDTENPKEEELIMQWKRAGVNRSLSITGLALIALPGLVLGLSGKHLGMIESYQGEARAEAASRATVSPGFASVRYHIDSSHSKFTIRAFASGLLSFAAHNHNIAIRDFTGDAEVTYGSVEPASLNMRVKADSLAVTDKVSDSDRKKIETTMRNDVLETAKYPDIIFQSSGVSATRMDEGKYQVKIPGSLILHGVTHNVVLNARLEFGTSDFHAVGEFPIKQSEFGIKPVSVAGGTIKVKDEVRLSFDIMARK